MEKRVALLIIDCQNDFCNPNGSLFVPGAVEDNERLSKWILYNKDKINYIGCTLDSHQINDIAHPGYWRDKDGNHPDPYTSITVDDVKNGKWNAIKPQHALYYLQTLESEGEYAHVIWPEHCLIGTSGHAIDDKVNQALQSWSRGGKSIQYVTKGSFPDTEHFGAFEAQVPIKNIASTQYNLKLQETLERYDVVYLAGQARNFCVVNTMKQMINKAPNLVKKMIILNDCMSDVPGFDGLGEDVWDKAKSLGAKISTSDKENLNAMSGAPVNM